MCQPVGSKEGYIVLGGGGGRGGIWCDRGESSRFKLLKSLSFDVENNLYVVNYENNRI